MAQTLTQSYLNNRLPGNVANDIYKATHGGQGNKPVVYNNGSGNYTSTSKSPNGSTSVEYHLNGSTKYDTSPIGGGSKTGPSSDGGSGSGGGGEGEYGGGYSGGGGGGYYEEPGGGGGGADYAAMISEMLAAQRAAAQAAYDASRSRLDEAYGNTYAALEKNLSSALNTLKKNYEFGQGVQRDDANKSLREAYINYMMNKRNMNQNLAAAGMSGGATESSLAKLYNNYGNSRNNINTTLAQNLAQLLNTYQNNVASAREAYNSQDAEARQNYANALNQLEQALAGNMMSSYSGSSLSSLASFAKTLSDITGGMGTAASIFTPTENTLGVDTVTAEMNNNMGTITDYAKYLAMLEQMGQAI